MGGLPNGMALESEFNWALSGRVDLFATDGRTRLALNVEFVCFNDRYVYVQSYERAFSSLYDADIDGKVDGLDYSEAMSLSGLSLPGGGCNGYYTGWVGPGLMFDGARVPHAPSCEWRNLDNEALRQREWFDRPCTPGNWPSRIE